MKHKTSLNAKLSPFMSSEFGKPTRPTYYINWHRKIWAWTSKPQCPIAVIMRAIGKSYTQEIIKRSFSKISIRLKQIELKCSPVSNGTSDLPPLLSMTST